MIAAHLNSIGKHLYENIILMGDFNSEMSANPIQLFCITYKLKCLLKEPICFKNVENTRLTNHYVSKTQWLLKPCYLIFIN